MASFVPSLQLSLRAGIGAGLAVLAARVLLLPFPIYAMIAAVIVTDLSPRKTRSLAAQRIAGTVLGAAIGVGLSPLAPAVWAIAAGVGASMLACQALGIREAARLAGYVAGIVLLEHNASAWGYAWDRLVETLLGIAVAVLVSLVPKLLRVEEEPRAPAS